MRDLRYFFVFQTPFKVTLSDASSRGCGAVIYINDGEHVCHKMWSEAERAKSSTWRELAAIEYTMLSCWPILSGSRIK